MINRIGKSTMHRAGMALGLWLLATGRSWAIWTGLLVPAYFSPEQTADWQALATAAGRVPLIAIANVSNGPGTERLESVRRVLDQVREGGGRVVGYVHTTYGKRALDEVVADADRWSDFYGVDGVFVDEMTNDGAATNLLYYGDLYRRVREKSRSLMVIGNPGTQTREAYLTTPAADLLVVFENRVGYTSYARDLWTRNHPSETFAHLCYDVPNASLMTTYLTLARSRGASWVYVTDDRLPNPWDRLPGYWSTLLSDVEQRNTGEVPRVRIERNGTGGLVLKIQSIPGRHVVHMSANLVTWGEFATVRTLSGEAELVLPPAVQSPRYFRVSR